jgi:hypothetical protein
MTFDFLSDRIMRQIIEIFLKLKSSSKNCQLKGKRKGKWQMTRQQYGNMNGRQRGRIKS